MRNKITFEWDIETLEAAREGDDYEGEPDILDHSHADTLREFTRDMLALALHGQGARLVLVRNVGNEFDGITDRAWAYVNGGELPGCFEYCDGAGNVGPGVPRRFHTELLRWRERNGHLA